MWSGICGVAHGRHGKEKVCGARALLGEPIKTFSKVHATRSRRFVRKRVQAVEPHIQQPVSDTEQHQCDAAADAAAAAAAAASLVLLPLRRAASH